MARQSEDGYTVHVHLIIISIHGRIVKVSDS